MVWHHYTDPPVTRRISFGLLWVVTWKIWFPSSFSKKNWCMLQSFEAFFFFRAFTSFKHFIYCRLYILNANFSYCDGIYWNHCMHWNVFSPSFSSLSLTLIHEPCIFNPPHHDSFSSASRSGSNNLCHGDFVWYVVVSQLFSVCFEEEKCLSIDFVDLCVCDCISP